MSLFVLQEGYRVVAAPGGGRVIHVPTGKNLDLSPEEVQVFARATAGGVDARDPQLRGLIRKFAQLGVLVSAKEVGPATGRTPAPATPAAIRAPPQVAPATATQKMEPISSVRHKAAARGTAAEKQSSPTSPKPGAEDAVRLFRRDLSVNRRGSSSLFDVNDPVASRTFPLYDFEVSLAKMLDGRRRYSEVVDAGQRLGIPVNLESLFQFVRQLDAYGFLAPPGALVKEETQEASKWAPRRQWDEALRALFQSGLKMHRHGRYHEAVNYFQAMLEQDPQNPEALEMLEQARQRISSSPTEETQRPGSAADSAQKTVSQLMAAEDTFFLEPPDSGATLSAPAFPEPASSEPGLSEPDLSESGFSEPDLSEVDSAPISKPRIPSGALTTNPFPSPRKKWLVAGVIGVVTIGAGAGAAWFFTQMAPPPSSRYVPRTAGRTESQPDGGTAVASAAAHRPSSPDVEKSLAAASLSPDAGTSAPAAPAMREPAVIKAGSAAVVEPGVSTAPQLKPAARWITAKIERHRRPRIGDVRAPADGVLKWKASQQQRVRGGEVVGTVQEKHSSKEQLVIAPKDGLFVPKVREGTKTSKSKKVATLLSSLVELQAFVSSARPETTWGCELFDEASGKKASCRVVTVDARGSRYRVTVMTESIDFDTAAKAVLRLSPQS